MCLTVICGIRKGIFYLLVYSPLIFYYYLLLSLSILSMIRSEKLQLRQAEYVLPVWKENGNCSKASSVLFLNTMFLLISCVRIVVDLLKLSDFFVLGMATMFPDFLS